MTTVINNPGGESRESSGIGFMFGIIILVALGAVLLIYFLPELRTTEIPVPENRNTIEMEVPSVPPPQPTEPSQPSEPTPPNTTPAQ